MTRDVALALWVLAAALLAGAEVAGRATRRRYATLQDLADRLTSTTARTLAAFLGWMWLGWHLFAR